jgi:hypothetical protein
VSIFRPVQQLDEVDGYPELDGLRLAILLTKLLGPVSEQRADDESTKVTKTSSKR